jgi:hypothetical protein
MWLFPIGINTIELHEWIQLFTRKKSSREFRVLTSIDWVFIIFTSGDIHSNEIDDFYSMLKFKFFLDIFKGHNKVKKIQKRLVCYVFISLSFEFSFEREILFSFALGCVFQIKAVYIGNIFSDEILLKFVDEWKPFTLQRFCEFLKSYVIDQCLLHFKIRRLNDLINRWWPSLRPLLCILRKIFSQNTKKGGVRLTCLDHLRSGVEVKKLLDKHKYSNHFVRKLPLLRPFLCIYIWSISLKWVELRIFFKNPTSSSCSV